MQLPVLQVPNSSVTNMGTEELITRHRNSQKSGSEGLNVSTVALGDRADPGEKPLKKLYLDLSSIDARHKLFELLDQYRTPFVYYCLRTEFGVRG